MIRTAGGMLIAVALLAATAPLLAHHSFAAQYDRTKAHTISGTVTKMEWQNPHIYFYVNVKDPSGKETLWAVEGMAPNGLYRQGWRKDTVKVGDVVTVDGWLARDGSNLLNMGGAKMADGRQLFTGAAQ
jgi:uncharacterized protein DUF6152